MRENLFRAKRIDNKKWTEGNLVKSSDADQGFGAIIIPTENSNMYLRKKENDLGFEVWHPVIPETVCQYTGKPDDNNKQIFEDDFVIIDNEWVGRIVWMDDATAFCVMPNGNAGRETYCLGYYTEEGYGIKVIGNIFDNPELIGEQGK